MAIARGLAALFFVGAGMAIPAFAQPAPTQDSLCSSSDTSPAARVAACSAVIATENDQGGVAMFAHLDRASARIRLGDLASAMADYDRAIVVNPVFAPARMMRARLHVRRGDPRRAAADYGEVVRLLGDHVEALNGLCWNTALADGDLTQARAACDRALRVAPTRADIFDSRGLVGLKQQRFEDAWRDYDAAVRIDPSQASYLYGRGVAALRLGRAAQGRDDMVRATRMDAGIERTYAGYGVRTGGR